GKSEHSFLERFTPEKAKQRIEEFMSKKPVAVVVARGLDVEEAYIELAKKYNVPMLSTEESTSAFSSALNSFLNLHLAPRVTRHGVLVEVYGEGILLLGESGVGKSETAIELVKRGHRLIADDAVEIRKVSSKSLVGTAPDNIRHFIELRGIGIINASRIFGAGAVKLTEKINLVINLEPWDVNKVYDRMGLESQTTEILGLTIPSLTIPVKPGRNLAVIIEVAAMNSRQKKLGYNAAEDLLNRLGMSDDFSAPPPIESAKPFD
ncbi:MAG: HPr(Ser) kinase/phosphatase, partial [Clostridia bacterium]|nr:HPr(Ser) kinase/phosphatase [Clostridia bacterium]